jgi:hypothetical protein
MKRYAVSYIDWFNNDLQTVIIKAETALDAMKQDFVDRGFELPEEEISSEEAFKSMCFDCDCMMNAIEI